MRTDGKIVCFFKSARSSRSYAMLGFNDAAKLDEGVMWAIGSR